MRRFEATQLVLKHAGNSPIVSNLGPTTDELWHAGHRDRNFYTYGSMGLCSSIALGMALSTTERVISLDGDGSLLMNLGTLATIGREQPKNLIVLFWDNEQSGQTGHHPSPTALRRHAARRVARTPAYRQICPAAVQTYRQAAQQARLATGSVRSGLRLVDRLPSPRYAYRRNYPK